MTAGGKGGGNKEYQDVFKNILVQLQPAVEKEGSISRTVLGL
jgi:hypothetical protein